MKLLRKMRHYFMGLSPSDVLRVKYKLVTLYLEPGEFIEVPPPEGFYVGNIRIYPGQQPLFSWGEGKVKLWLKNKLAWDIQIDECDVETVPFDYHLAEPAVKILKSFATYFPFLPRDNFLSNNGKFVA